MAGEEQEQKQEQGQEQGQGQEQKRPKKYHHWHGIVQTVVIIVALGACAGVVCWMIFGSLHVCDMILIVETIMALAIGIICSHAYNYIPGSETDPLRGEVAKNKAIWLHANFSWKTISIWMTVTSLYCTCATIYISGSSLNLNEAWAQDHIIIYSVLSLVFSLGMYVLRPSNRATGYRKAYLIATKALVDDNSSNQQNLKEALIKGEEIIAKQDTFSPG